MVFIRFINFCYDVSSSCNKNSQTLEPFDEGATSLITSIFRASRLISIGSLALRPCHCAVIEA